MDSSSETKLVSAEDMLAKMRAGTKATYELKMRDLVIPVRILSLDEELDIRNRMIAQNSKKGGDQVSLAAMVQKETIKTASFLGKGESSLPERLFEMMSRDELIYFYNEYIKLAEEVNPGLEQIKPEQFEALVTAIKKKQCDRERLIFSAIESGFFQLSRFDSETGFSNLTKGQFCWWAVLKTALNQEKIEQHEAIINGRHRN